MLVKCSSNDIPCIIRYIGNEYKKCLYLYMNLLQYGTDSDKVEVYLQRNGEDITAILLKYYSCLHIYSRNNDFDQSGIDEIINTGGITMVYCTKETGERIWRTYFTNASASITFGWVAQITKVDSTGPILCEKAKDEDFEQIARMIYEDEDIGRSYDYNSLVAQMQERSKDGYTRNLVIRNGKTVIAHACTNAETSQIAVVAELIVNKAYRRKGYASNIWLNICSQLLREGKEVYSFYYSKESRDLHRKIGFFETCEWSKIVFQREEV